MAAPADRPLVLAHRGASARARENTLAAFSLAADLGADWVELDVRTTADGALVLHHDPELPDGRVVAEVPVGELPHDVPTLAAALDLCDEAGLGVNVELKALPGEADQATAPTLADEAAALLLARTEGWDVADLDARLLVTCFDPRTLDRLRHRAGDRLPTGLLSLVGPDHAAAVALALGGGHRALNPWDAHTTAALVADARAAGLQVNVWTVDDPARHVELAGWGVTGLITNEPDVARQALAGDGG